MPKLHLLLIIYLLKSHRLGILDKVRGILVLFQKKDQSILGVTLKEIEAKDEKPQQTENVI